MDIKNTLARFFHDARGICGAEKTFHALFYHHWLTSGLPGTRIAREYRLNGAPVDLVLFKAGVDTNRGGSSTEVQVAFEFKGGAYNTRNALHDRVSPFGPISDLDKLAALSATGLQAWFICIDLPELGTALSEQDAKIVGHRCAERGVHFAYFHQARDSFLCCAPDEDIERHPLTGTTETPAVAAGSIAALFEVGNPLFGMLAREAVAVAGSEDNGVALIYHLLRKNGFDSQQLSLETYFNFANRKRSRMPWRPDLSVFDLSVKGRFNLYRNGNPACSNDAFKLVRLRALIEVKGSKALDRKSDSALAKIYAEDIGKLAQWRSLIKGARLDLGLNGLTELEYRFVGIDHRARGFSPQALVDLMAVASRQGVKFTYLAKASA